MFNFNKSASRLAIAASLCFSGASIAEAQALPDHLKSSEDYIQATIKLVNACTKETSREKALENLTKGMLSAKTAKYGSVEITGDCNYLTAMHTAENGSIQELSSNLIGHMSYLFHSANNAPCLNGKRKAEVDVRGLDYSITRFELTCR